MSCLRLLQPIEEIVFSHYSQLTAACRLEAAAGDGTSSVSSGDTKSVSSGGSDDACVLLPLPALARMHALMRAASIFGILFVAFGPPYSYLLLRLLYGATWTATDAPALLGAYCVHVCAMAINGVGEAFVNATASPAELAALSRRLVALAAVYLPVAALALSYAGAIGLVAANALNMGARIAYACVVIRRLAAASMAAAPAAASAAPPLRLLPQPAVLAGLAAAALVTNAAGWTLGAPSARTVVHHAIHVAVGGACLLGVGVAVWRAEPELLDALRTARREARAKRSE